VLACVSMLLELPLSGLKKSTRQLVFTSKIRDRARRFFVMLVLTGKWYFQSQ